jgi:hypothetical protein
MLENNHTFLSGHFSVWDEAGAWKGATSAYRLTTSTSDAIVSNVAHDFWTTNFL